MSNEKQSNLGSYIVLTIIAFLLPIVGFILGIVYAGKNNQKDRTLGQYLLLASIVFFLFWFVVFTNGATQVDTSSI